MRLVLLLNMLKMNILCRFSWPYSRLKDSLSKHGLGRPFLPTREGKPLPQMVKGFPTQEFVAGRSRVWPPLKLVISVEQGTDNTGHGAPIPPLPGKG
jgi:hypothetical protein